MYFWLFAGVVVVWLWLAGGSAYGWWKGRIGGFYSGVGVLFWSGVAGAVLLFVGPYWRAIYWILLQPG